MSMVITGATGHLGRLVVESLLSRGVSPSEIVATGRDIEKIKDLADRGVAVRRADFADPDSLTAAFSGARTLLLISATTAGERFDNHRRAIDAAESTGVSTVIYTSSSNADSATMRLATEHFLTEAYLRDSGIHHVVLRNSWYLENYTDQLPLYLRHGTVAGSAGQGRVSAATRADYAEAAAIVMTTEGHLGAVYELGGDHAFSLSELAEALSTATGEKIGYADLHTADFEAMLTGAGVPRALAEVLSDADLGLARGELHTDTRDLSRLLGRPTTTLAEAISAAVARSSAQ